MKKIAYLSPTSIALFYKDVREFYLNYLSDNRPERFPQTRPMSIGSAFDAYVKSYLHEALFGKGKDPAYAFEALFEKQVEAHNRDWALTAGRFAFECYKLSGALADMMIELNKATNAPRFEFELRGTVTSPLTYNDGKITSDWLLNIGGKWLNNECTKVGFERIWLEDGQMCAPECHPVPADQMTQTQVYDILDSANVPHTKVTPPMVLLGKPDLHFKNSQSHDITFDWKVNGFCGKSNTSPKPGYVKLRDGWGGNQSRTHGMSHKDAFIMAHKGTMINAAATLDKVDRQWADQLTIYAWMLGMEIGSDFIVALDQLACSPSSEADRPRIRIAEHRTTVDKDYQHDLYKRAQHVWDVVHSGHIFRDLPLEESKAKCASLDNVASALAGEGTEEDAWFARATRGTQSRAFGGVDA